jgi:division protein CdvB (Snf7/Vps24/ESCRT-III family)
MQAMGTMNKRMNIPALAKIMKEFERQNAKMDQVEEMMGDAMDDVFEVLVLTLHQCHSHLRSLNSDYCGPCAVCVKTLFWFTGRG